MLHLDNEIFRVESCRVERARHEGCRYQRGLVTKFVVIKRARHESCRFLEDS